MNPTANSRPSSTAARLTAGSCGNSLIGPDFFHGRQVTLLGDDDLTRINPFDWPAEFPEIMVGGGFDAVIGNPPYIRIQNCNLNARRLLQL